MRGALSPDAVVDAAMAMVERDGADQLSMRKLAADLGVSVNTIYWHVGSREQLLDAVIERAAERYGRIRVRGNDPRERVFYVARRMWEDFLANQQVAVLAHARGDTGSLVLPLQLALAREVVAAGLRGEEAAAAMRGILYAIGGLMVVAFRPPAASSAESVWAKVPDDAVDPELRDAMAAPPDLDDLFDRTVRALVDAFIPAG